MTERRVFHVSDAATYIGLSRSTIYELIKAGEIELGKLHGRSVIKREVLDAFLERNYQKAG